jgi:AraC-like DNA-binding protein
MGGVYPYSPHRRPLHQAVDFKGPLSLRVVLRGQAAWRTATRRYTVDAGFCLVLNEGENYSLVFDTAEPVETFCPFFARGFVEDAAGSLLASDDALLDPSRTTAGRLAFAPHVRPLPPELAATLGGLRRLARAGECDDLSWDDAFFDLAQALARASTGWHAEHGGRSHRHATRAEITRRLDRARDYIHAEAHRPLVLADIADVASLSPHHFHRLFKVAFHSTPGVYVRRLRLERAARRIAATDAPITEICFAAGFESLGSFSTRFAREFGASPAAWRRIARSEKSATPCRV